MFMCFSWNKAYSKVEQVEKLGQAVFKQGNIVLIKTLWSVLIVGFCRIDSSKGIRHSENVIVSYPIF